MQNYNKSSIEKSRNYKMSSYEERKDIQADNIDMASRAMQDGIQKAYQGGVNLIIKIKTICYV